MTIYRMVCLLILAHDALISEHGVTFGVKLET